MKSVNLYHGYAADARISMDVYANSFSDGLNLAGFRTTMVQAQSSLERFRNSVWLMRWLRYRSFPRQTRAAPSATVHHVADHGYAHLHPALGAGKSCITVHDLIPLMSYRQSIPSAKGLQQRKPHLNLYSMSFLSRYDLIVAVSETTKQDLVEHLAIDEHKIFVIPPVISEEFRTLPRAAVTEFAQHHSLDLNKKWIMLSGSEFYKNSEVALNVFELVREKLGDSVGLLKTGHPDGAFSEQIKKRGLSDHVRQIFLASTNEMPLVYNFVDCLLFPSLYEGFGMPVLEAIACHTPAIASNGGALRELAPTLIEHCDPNDVRSLADKVIQSLLDDSVQKKIAAESYSVLAPYRVANIAKQLEKVYA